MTVIRPGDANEAVEAWRVLMGSAEGARRPRALRQKLPGPGPHEARSGVGRRARRVRPRRGVHAARPVILIATGSEVALALAAREKLEADGIATRVVSMPSWEIFDEQRTSYREEVTADRP